MTTEQPAQMSASTTVADLVGLEQVMDPGIHGLWNGMPSLSGPAHVVRCAPGDNLMMHAAIYRAAPGSVIVVDSGESAAAVAGGNVCAVAQRRGISGLVVDGHIRDLSEVRQAGFPVFARGVFPKPGTKENVIHSDEILVGGVCVRNGDLVVADEEGIVVIPAEDISRIVPAAEERERSDAEQSLDVWEAAHRAKISEALGRGGDDEGLPA